MRIAAGLVFLSFVLASPEVAHSQEDTDAQPIRPPVPSYPQMAAMLGLQGYCEVTFSVDEDGNPFSLSTSCTQPIFCYQSMKAISRVQFAPKLVNGAPAPRFNVVYPLEYRLQDSGRDIERSTIRPCDERAVS